MNKMMFVAVGVLGVGLITAGVIGIINEEPEKYACDGAVRMSVFSDSAGNTYTYWASTHPCHIPYRITKESWEKTND